jgi:hypothetical protein
VVVVVFVFVFAVFVFVFAVFVFVFAVFVFVFAVFVFVVVVVVVMVAVVVVAPAVVVAAVEMSLSDSRVMIVLCLARPQARSQAKPGPNRPGQAKPKCWLHGGFGRACISEKPKPSHEAPASWTV